MRGRGRWADGSECSSFLRFPNKHIPMQQNTAQHMQLHRDPFSHHNGPFHLSLSTPRSPFPSFSLPPLPLAAPPLFVVSFVCWLSGLPPFFFFTTWRLHSLLRRDTVFKTTAFAQGLLPFHPLECMHGVSARPVQF